MKVTVEIDCTPEEARRTMGLPDIAAFQQNYVATLMEMGEGGTKPEALAALLKGWAPMGEAGLGIWRALVEAAGTKDGPR